MTIRVGIIGRNFVVAWMLAAMEQVPELRPAAIYSRNEETGREFAKKYHLDAVFTDLEAFAASDAFDAAYIASPNICHFEQAMCLLRHGKHVLLEKPGVLSRKQAEKLVKTANANHVVYLEAMRLVFDDALPIIRDALPEIGTLRRVTAEFTQYSSRYDRVRAGEPHINAFDPALCNAAILDMGCYPIHALISLFGEPAHVSAEAYHLESGFEAGGIALLIHLSGLTSLDVSYLAPFSDARARRAVLRPLLVRQKWRDTALHPQDLKNQGDDHIAVDIQIIMICCTYSPNIVRTKEKENKLLVRYKNKLAIAYVFA